MAGWYATPDREGDRVTRKPYHKLVRDRIPRIVREGGSTCGSESYDDDRAWMERLIAYGARLLRSLLPLTLRVLKDPNFHVACR